MLPVKKRNPNIRRVLFVEDTEHYHEAIKGLSSEFKKRRMIVAQARSMDEALKILKRHPEITEILSDIQLSHDYQRQPSGIELAREARKINPKSVIKMHSMAAEDFKKHPELLKKFGLTPEDIFHKTRLAELLKLEAKHQRLFGHGPLGFAKAFQESGVPFRVIYINEEHATQARQVGIHPENLVEVPFVLASYLDAIAKSRRKNVTIIVGKDKESGPIAQALAMTIGTTSGVQTHITQSYAQALANGLKGHFILMEPTALESSIQTEQGARHDANHILDRLRKIQ